MFLLKKKKTTKNMTKNTPEKSYSWVYFKITLNLLHTKYLSLSAVAILDSEREGPGKEAYQG